MALAVGFKISLDDQQTGVFALRAGVGLQADAGVAGGLAQPVAQLLVQLGVALQLVVRRKRVDVGKLGPGDGNHLAGGVELHGAAAQRDHAAVQRQILVAQRADVAQHAGFGVVGVEHRMRQKGAGAAQLGGNQRRRCLASKSLTMRQRSGRAWQRRTRAVRCRRGVVVSSSDTPRWFFK